MVWSSGSGPFTLVLGCAAQPVIQVGAGYRLIYLRTAQILRTFHAFSGIKASITFAPIPSLAKRLFDTLLRLRYDGTHRVPYINSMSEQTQQEYLKAAKAVLAMQWDSFAEKAGISPRAFKTYRMPPTSKDFRPLPPLAKQAIDRLLKEHERRTKTASNQP